MKNYTFMKSKTESMLIVHDVNFGRVGLKNAARDVY